MADLSTALMRDPILSVDLDSTLADTRHRRGIIEQFRERGEEIDWSVYALACAEDEPTGFAHMLRILQETVPWVVVSGRSEGSRDATVAWLEKWGLKPEAVYLEDDTEKHSTMGHHSWKAMRVLEIYDMYPSIKIHIDDWSQIADLLQRSGKVSGVTVLPPGMVPAFPDDPRSAPEAL